MAAFRKAIFLCTIGFALADRDVATVFVEMKVKPDVLNEVPRELIEVKYGDKVLEPGNELTPTEVKNIPEIHYKQESDVFYTLIMTDPGPPTREGQTPKEWLHWYVGNIPGENISKGDLLAEYVGAGPTYNTGFHRYVFLIYKQPGKLEFDEQRLKSGSAVGRDHFSTEKFATKYNLGNPIAGNLFQAQYDDYVPLLYQQLGI